MVNTLADISCLNPEVGVPRKYASSCPAQWLAHSESSHLILVFLLQLCQQIYLEIPTMRLQYKMKSIELRSRLRYCVWDFNYVVNVVTKNATNTPYPLISAWGINIRLGLWLQIAMLCRGYCLFTILPMASGLSSVIQKKDVRNQIICPCRNFPRAKTTLFRLMLSESDPMPFLPTLPTYIHLQTRRSRCILAVTK